jgi:hypothetical protein
MQRDGTSALHKVTMGYNMARLQEETGDIKAACQAYKVGKQAHPVHSLRQSHKLGAMLGDRGGCVLCSLVTGHHL